MPQNLVDYRIVCLSFLLGFHLATPLAAQTPTVETVLNGLNHPCGVAVHPETGIVYVSDSGNGKIIRIVDGKPQDVVTDYPVAAVSDEFGFAAGPLGIGFVGRNNLLVTGSGGWVAGEDRVSLFDLKDTPLSFEDAGLFAVLDSQTAPNGTSQGDFFGIATHDDRVWVTGRGDPDYGWVSQLTQKKNGTARFECRIETWKATETRLPTAITISPDGFVVVGQHGENGNPSVLGFYDQAKGDLRAKFQLGQHGVVALSYGPNAGRLYALFNSRRDPARNGLYKLVARKRNTVCEAQLVKEIADPWAMAFASTGDLFVTAGREDGLLLMIRGIDKPVTSDSPD